MYRLPKDNNKLPKAGDDDAEAPNAGAEAPKAGDDEAPKTDVEPKGDEPVIPNTPVEVLPKKELPVCDPKGVVLPKGLGAKGLLLALLVCPKTDCDPNGLLDDCPKAAKIISAVVNAMKRCHGTKKKYSCHFH